MHHLKPYFGDLQVHLGLLAFEAILAAGSARARHATKSIVLCYPSPAVA
jgi:hypothetical protein